MDSPGNQRENEVVLLCARAQLAPDAAQRLRELASVELDWDYVYKLARRHSLLPLVYAQLDRAAGDAFPPDVSNRFRKAYQENAARNLVLVDELLSVIRACEEAGIETIVYKGPALAISAYGNLALRRFVDLDVMVHRRNVERAIQVLTARGYVAAKHITGAQQAVLLRTQHNLQFTRGRIIVELHWQVSSELFASSVTAEQLWDHLETIKLTNTEVKTLSTDELLFSLSVHGSRHLWQRLSWISDIAHILANRTDINWAALMTRAEETKTERMFLLGPALAQKLLSAPVPELIGKAIEQDKRIASLIDEARERLFYGTEQLPNSLGEIFRYNLLVRRSWSSRFRYFRFMLSPTDSDLEGVKLSRPLHFAYYLLRPFRLLAGKTG